MYPKVICHIMSSVDGRLLTDRWTTPFDGKSKNELLGIYAAIGRKLDTDAWMFGKRTLTEGFFPRKFRPAVLKTSPRPEIFVASRSSERLFIVADPEADILYDSSTVRGDNIAVILPETTPAAYLERLRQQNISYLFAGRDGNDLPQAMPYGQSSGRRLAIHVLLRCISAGNFLPGKEHGPNNCCKRPCPIRQGYPL